MEVKVDPMLVLQCSFEEEEDDEEEEFSTDTLSDTDSLASKDKSEDEAFNLSDTLYICNICPKSFTTENNLAKHLNDHIPKSKRILTNNHNGNSHLQQDSSSTSNEAEFSCPICGKVISTKGNLKVHLETHKPKGKYACDICGRM